MRRALALCLALAACAHAQPIREIRVPVSQPCINIADVPVETPPFGPAPNDARQAADALAGLVLDLRGEIRHLRALIGPCTH